MSMGLTSTESTYLNNLYKNIGANIHKARIHNKLTIEKLSKISGLKTDTIEKYEMGFSKMNFKVLLKLANILKVHISDFIAGH